VTRTRIVVIGTPDTVLGLGLVGVAGTAVVDDVTAAAALEAARQEPDVAMVLVSGRFAAALPPDLGDDGGPLVVELPDGGGRTASLQERVASLLGHVGAAS